MKNQKIDPAVQAVIDGIPEPFRERYKRRAMKVASSGTAAIFLKCLDCCGWEYGEVQRCEDVTCSLHARRTKIFFRSSAQEKELKTA